jgi:RND family efflux transporter MFP subunit
MTQSNNDKSQTDSETHERSSFGGLLLRIMLPIGILAVGGFAYSKLSVSTEEEKSPPSRDKILRSRVTALNSGDHQVFVKTHGIVQAHNETTLSAQVSGQITRIDPAFEIGSYFAEGDVLVELDPRDYETRLSMAEASHLSAVASDKLATQDHDRIMDLFENDNIGTQADVDLAIATRSRAAAELDSVKAQLDQAKRDLDRSTVRAPFAGRVRTKMVGLGQSVNPGMPLGMVFAVDYAEVRLPIAARQQGFLELPEMEGDTPVEVKLRDTISDASDTVWNARIVRTEGALDQDSLELFAIARIDDPFGLQSKHPPLRIGQPVEGSIDGIMLNDVMALPRRAVRELDRINLVNEADMTLMVMNVTALWADEDHIYIREPLIEEGALLCTTHIVHAPDGAAIEIIPDIEPSTRKRRATDGIDS